MYQLIKDFIINIDKNFFKGKLRLLYRSFKERKKQTFWKGKKSVILSEPVPDMVLMQYNINDYFQYQFYDLGVRYLAVENYYNKNNVGFALYQKMHTLGGNYGHNNPTEEYYKKMQNKKKTAQYGRFEERHSIEQFKDLILSYEKNGYDESSAIMADKNLLSMNGSHRITLALYNCQEFITTDIHKTLFKRTYSLDWFWKQGFSQEEISLIRDTTENLIEECKKKIGFYYCILYPPAYEYFDEITKDIGMIDPNNIQVIEYCDYNMEINEFKCFLKCIYSFDSINEKNLNRKIFYILNASEIENGMLPLRIVKVNINNPLYRLKTDSGMPESMATVRLKDAIRGRYKVKDEKFTKHYKRDYAHDVIIHSTDNYLSNKALSILLNINRDISDLFNMLKNYKYSIIESGADKLSKFFPNNFYLNEDIDIFVNKKDLDMIFNIIYDYSKSHFNQEWMEIKTEFSSCGKRVRVLLKNCLIIMFDLMTCMPELNEKYVSDCLSRREYSSYYHLSIEDELLVRLAKYAHAPSKTWHADFINNNKNKFIFNDNAFSNPDKMKKIYKKITTCERTSTKK